MFSEIQKDEPIFNISSAARMLKISVHTLRMYEREGLIIPYKKKSNHRLFSKMDLERIECIRKAINESKISINGIKSMYSLIPCWEILKCPDEHRTTCTSYLQHSEPCWKIEHPKTICENKECRECPTYQKYSNCGEIKELIKSISR